MNLSDLSNRGTYTNLANIFVEEGSHTNTVTVNGVTVAVDNGSTTVANTSKTSGTENVTLDEYSSPSKVVLDTFDKLGQDIDKSLKSDFLLQSFGIKGTDMACSVFCFLLSLMSCSAKNSLYEAINNINTGISTANTVLSATKNIVNTFNAAGEAAGKVITSVNNIFSEDKITSSSVLSDTEALSVLIAIPESISNSINLIEKALKFANNFKFAIPDFVGWGIWDLAQNVLFAMQATLVSILDETLNTLFKPLEDLINNIVPSSCFNTMADRIRVRILQAITSIKSRIKQEIADIFAANNGFNIKYRTINARLGWSLELEAYLNAIEFVMKNFTMIAIGCGLEPCSANTSSYNPAYASRGIEDFLSDDSVSPFSYPIESLPIYTTENTSDISNSIDDIAEKLKDFTNSSNVSVDNNTITSTYKTDSNIPSQIKDFINDGIYNYILNSNYTVNTKDATVTYQFVKKCS